MGWILTDRHGVGCQYGTWVRDGKNVRDVGGMGLAFLEFVTNTELMSVIWYYIECMQWREWS